MRVTLRPGEPRPYGVRRQSDYTFHAFLRSNPNGKIGRALPPHPNPLPQGEGWGEGEQGTRPEPTWRNRDACKEQGRAKRRTLDACSYGTRRKNRVGHAVNDFFVSRANGREHAAKLRADRLGFTGDE